ncbi:uncharacterized protein BBA_07422 [Beauveria bassiana ARSEF 2860]|uniref:Transcription factor domain-containing protein n=1 Tax=Beauveria bassiana (strain ARSEF 2860) TaxID=655819 RepID=J5JCR7_BEAB2|nr:uncharacterized protein BBA_07422 [Beauveria bassiana ARSEF 2860]EJP63778.1 hypothetical protein BBA_07422 [Beauveria bassiana ARSEF 2860]
MFINAPIYETRPARTACFFPSLFSSYVQRNTFHFDAIVAASTIRSTVSVLTVTDSLANATSRQPWQLMLNPHIGTLLAAVAGHAKSNVTVADHIVSLVVTVALLGNASIQQQQEAVVRSASQVSITDLAYRQHLLTGREGSTSDSTTSNESEANTLDVTLLAVDTTVTAPDETLTCCDLDVGEPDIAFDSYVLDDHSTFTHSSAFYSDGFNNLDGLDTDGHTLPPSQACGQALDDELMPEILANPPPSSNSSATTEELNSLEEVPPHLATLLLETFFTMCRSTFRLFESSQEILHLSSSSLSHEEAALRYAILAHAAPTCTKFLAWAAATDATAAAQNCARYFYSLACEERSKCNIDPKVCFVSSLRALQATVLIGLYELQQAQFGCAWITTSKADWLTHAMQLRTRDFGQKFNLTGPEMLHQARRAQWASSSLACMLMKGGRMCDSVDETTAWLPEVTESSTVPEAGICIEDVFQNAAPRPLTVEQALLSVHLLTWHIVKHFKNTNTTSPGPNKVPYNFWLNHHRLEQTLLYIRNFLKKDSKPEPSAEFMLDTYVKAWSIALQEAVLRKRATSPSTHDGAGQDQTIEATLLRQTLRLAQTLQSCVLPSDAASLVNISWIIHTVLQSLHRRKRLRSSLAAFDILPDWNSYLYSDQQYELLLSPDRPGSASDMTNILLMDASDALQFLLASMANELPIAKFFLKNHERERNSSEGDLGRVLISRQKL